MGVSMKSHYQHEKGQIKDCNSDTIDEILAETKDTTLEVVCILNHSFVSRNLRMYAHGT